MAFEIHDRRGDEQKSKLPASSLLYKLHLGDRGSGIAGLGREFRGRICSSQA